MIAGAPNDGLPPLFFCVGDAPASAAGAASRSSSTVMADCVDVWRPAAAMLSVTVMRIVSTLYRTRAGNFIKLDAVVIFAEQVRATTTTDQTARF